MKTVAARMDLGMTRIAGYILFDPKSLEFHETTPREVERLVRQGQINGLKFNPEGELIPDLEGWNLGNVKIKSAVGNYRNWNTSDPRGDTCYSVVRAIDIQDVGRIYETINNRCGRVFYTGKQLAALSSMFWVGGITVDDNDNINLCQGVQVEDWSGREVYELGDKVLSKEQLQEQTMAELFGPAATNVTKDTESSEVNTDNTGTQEAMEGQEGQEDQGEQVAQEEQTAQEGQEAQVPEGEAQEIQSDKVEEVQTDDAAVQVEGQQEENTTPVTKDPQEVQQEQQEEANIPTEEVQVTGTETESQEQPEEAPEQAGESSAQTEDAPEQATDNSTGDEPKQPNKSTSHRSHKKKR